MPHRAAKLVFWGVRGSTPTPERNTWRYGGNTPCLDLLAPDGTRFILDCGTGLRMLGHLWSQLYGQKGMEASVLVTHYHWDHIQGIPFFQPFFHSASRFHFHSFQSEHLGPNSLRKVFEAQVASPYFPANVSMMTAERSFREIQGGESWQIGETRVTAAWLNHPQGCLGYRLDTSAGSFVYATDNEPGVAEFDRNLRELARGANVLIYDAQYSPQEIASSRKGWGHSSWLEGVKLAREADVANLILFHHDPDSSDHVVDHFLSDARAEFPATWAASEGMAISLSGRGIGVAVRDSRFGQRRPLHFAAVVSGQSEDGATFQENATVLDLSIQGAYLSLNNRPPLQSELQVQIGPTGDSPPHSTVPLRAIVVHRDPAHEKSPNGVGVIFTADPYESPERD